MKTPRNVIANVSLADYSTMRLGGEARYLAVVSTREELEESVHWAAAMEIAIMMLGGGSNTIFGEKGFAGLVLVNRILGYQASTPRDGWVEVSIGGGEVWDDAVGRTVDEGLSGIETLSLIPGTTGAAPVQNIGAYGVELDKAFVGLTAYDTAEQRWVEFSADECGFGYRTSRFKTVDRDRYLIAEVRLRMQQPEAFALADRLVRPPYYADIAARIGGQSDQLLAPARIREAVIAVRRAKLPDPAVVANTGSFFANPIISLPQYDELIRRHPDLDIPTADWPQPPRWHLPDGRVKLAAGGLIERVGLRGYRDEATGMGTWPTQALVLVNYSARTTVDLFKFRDYIVQKVEAAYGVHLVEEILLIGT